MASANSFICQAPKKGKLKQLVDVYPHGLLFCRQISCGEVFAPNFYSASSFLIICLWLLKGNTSPVPGPPGWKRTVFYASNYETNRWASFGDLVFEDSMDRGTRTSGRGPAHHKQMRVFLQDLSDGPTIKFHCAIDVGREGASFECWINSRSDFIGRRRAAHSGASCR
jgi:hypothetical protein